MRKYKFRGKRVDNGEWVHGNYFIDERDIEDGFIWREIPQIQQRYGDHYQYFDVIPETVGQFTGLHDKNGKEIYEGDIVEYEDFSNGMSKARGVIKIDNLLRGIYLKGLGSFEGEKVEVISNIFEED